MAIDSQATWQLVDALKDTSKTNEHTSLATVNRVDTEGRVWVSLPGGEVETPTETSNAEVKRGDTVTVEWRGNKLYILGNSSDPSVGAQRVDVIDELANQAYQSANEASINAGIAKAAAEAAEASAADAKQTADSVHDIAVQASEDAAAASTAAATASSKADAASTAAANAQTAAGNAQTAAQQATADAATAGRAASVAQAAAEAAQGDIDEMEEWFWHDTNGSHVLGATSGYRNDIDSTGMTIVETATEESVARFDVNGAAIGKDSQSRLVITNDSLTAYNNESVPFFDVAYDNGSIIGQFTNVFYIKPSGDYYLGERKRIGVVDVSAINAGIGITVTASSIAMSTKYRPASISEQTNVVAEITNDQIKFSQFNQVFTLNESKTIEASAAIVYEDYVVGTVTVGFELQYDANTKEITFYYFLNGSVSVDIFTIEPEYGSFKISGLAQTTAPAFVFGTNAGNTKGSFSATIGRELEAVNQNQFVVGKYNDNQSTTAFEIGNGTGDNNRSNAFAVDWYGNTKAAGDVTDGSGNVLSDKADTTDVYTKTQADALLADKADTTDLADYLPLVGGTLTGALDQDMPGIVRDTPPSSTQWIDRIALCDANGSIIGYIRTPFQTDGREGIQIETKRTVNGSEVYNGVQLYIDANGTRTVDLSDAAAWREAIGHNFAWDIGTNNTTDTWVPVYVNGALKHRVIPTAYNSTPLALNAGGTGQAGTTTANVTLTDAKVYGTEAVPTCYKWGKVVTIIGAVSPKAEVAANGTLTIGTIPSGYRPPRAMRTMCQGSSRNTWMLEVSTNGVMTASRYRSETGYNAIGTTAWLPFYVTYVIS